MTGALTAATGAGALAALTFVLTYSLGAAWWLSVLGRALMAQGVSLTVVLSYVVIRRLTSNVLPLPGDLAKLALGVFSLVAIAEWYLAISLVREMVTWRRAASQLRQLKGRSMTEPTPSVGRIVHYTSFGTPGGEYSKECRAAIITEVRADDRVALCVFNPSGEFHNRDVAHEEIDGKIAEKIEPGPSGRTGGTWHWPERV